MKSLTTVVFDKDSLDEIPAGDRGNGQPPTVRFEEDPHGGDYVPNCGKENENFCIDAAAEGEEADHFEC